MYSRTSTQYGFCTDVLLRLQQPRSAVAHDPTTRALSTNTYIRTRAVNIAPTLVYPAHAANVCARCRRVEVCAWGVCASSRGFTDNRSSSDLYRAVRSQETCAMIHTQCQLMQQLHHGEHEQLRHWQRSDLMVSMNSYVTGSAVASW